MDDAEHVVAISARVSAMTDAFDKALSVYAAHPIDDGDAVLFLDDRVCVEVPQLATEWDDQLRTNTAGILRRTASSVVVAIARPQLVLRPSDFQLWRDLHDELRETDIELRPLRALPAA